jgi:hypothetical protein
MCRIGLSIIREKKREVIYCFVIPDVQLHIVDTLWLAIAGCSAGPESLASFCRETH